MSIETKSSSAGQDNIDGLLCAAPYQVGMDETCLVALLDECKAKGQDLHTLLLFHGERLALKACWWPYADRPQVMHSVAKSFTSAAIGLALDEGRFALRDKVISFFPEYLPPVVDEKLAAMTVEDLLTMRSGHAAEISGAVWRRIDTSWIAEFFKVPVIHQPGTVYVYSSAASYMLSAILTKVTGETLHAYLRPRLFEPLGIEGEAWDIGVDGINPGGNGLTCRPVDLLKFGILYAQKGMWQGRRILPQKWVARSVQAHSQYGNQGYGYGYHWHTGPDGEFYATGLFGQVIAVYPAQDIVAILTSATPGPAPCMGQILPLLRKHIPDLVRGGVRDPALARRLEEIVSPQQLVSLAHPAPAHNGTRRYEILENPLGVTNLTIALSGDTCVLGLNDATGRHSVTMGIDRWIESETDISGQDLHHGYKLQPAKVVAGARWLDRDTLEMHWIFVETVFHDTVICRFSEGQLSYARSVNVNSGPLAQPVLIGKG